jgi:hypothetical protein
MPNQFIASFIPDPPRAKTSIEETPEKVIFYSSLVSSSLG